MKDLKQKHFMVLDISLLWEGSEHGVKPAQQQANQQPLVGGAQELTVSLAGRGPVLGLGPLGLDFFSAKDRLQCGMGWEKQLGESQGQRSLIGYCLWGRRESDTTEMT